MKLLTAHKILVGAAIALGAVLVLWGGVHGAGRGEPAGWLALALGSAAVPAGGLYLRKLFRNPPIS